MQDTDATGNLYFANQLQISLETFEEFMRQEEFSLTNMLKEKEFLLPIVHTESDFFAPLTLGEKVQVSLEFTHIGTTSFTCSTEFKKEEKIVGRASIVHVVYNLQKQISQPIPEILKKILIKKKCNKLSKRSI